jgi:hypothetical protein
MSQPEVCSRSSAKAGFDTRRRSVQIPATKEHQVHRQLPRLFSGRTVSSSSSSTTDSSESTESSVRSDFLAQATIYSRSMFKHHTASQMKTGTIPGHTKTMQAYTGNQMDHFVERSASKSEQASPRRATDQAMMAAKVIAGLSRLNLGEGPRGPANTPNFSKNQLHNFESGAHRKRGLTDPVLRVFANTSTRDFAVNPVKQSSVEVRSLEMAWN